MCTSTSISWLGLQRWKFGLEHKVKIINDNRQKVRKNMYSGEETKRSYAKIERHLPWYTLTSPTVPCKNLRASVEFSKAGTLSIGDGEGPYTSIGKCKCECGWECECTQDCNIDDVEGKRKREERRGEEWKAYLHVCIYIYMNSLHYIHIYLKIWIYIHT